MTLGCQDLLEPTASGEGEKFVEPPQSQVHAQVSAQLRGAAAAGDRSRGIESFILSLEARNPGVGGLFFDPDLQVLVVLLTDMTAAGTVVADITSNLSQSPIYGVDGIEAPGVPVVARKGTYPFSHLVAWKELLIPHLVQMDGWVFIDADERLNRVRIGVEELDAQSVVAEAVSGVGVPTEAIHYELSDRFETLSSLEDRFRPTGSGIQIANSAFPMEVCSYGWTVQQGTEWGLLTASHCTSSPTGEGDTGEGIYQATNTSPSDLLGHVAINPEWNVSGCAHSTCAQADAMFVSAATPSDLGQRLAWTHNHQFNNDTPGSTSISEWLDVSQSTGENMGGVVATGARKVGRTTGGTGGTIAGTCETHQLEDNGAFIVVLCLNRLTGASVGKGDSGGPVYGLVGPPTAPPTARPFGTVVGGGPLNEPTDLHDPTPPHCDRPDGPVYFSCTLLYSPIEAIEAHLGVSLTFGTNPPGGGGGSQPPPCEPEPGQITC